MKITVSGKQLKVGASLQEYINEELESSVTKYFENAISADVFFSKETHNFVADLKIIISKALAMPQLTWLQRSQLFQMMVKKWKMITQLLLPRNKLRLKL